MESYIILHKDDGLSPELVSHRINSLTGAFAYKGSVMCLPYAFGDVIAVFSPSECDSEAVCERMMRHLAGTFGADAFDTEGNEIFAYTDDNDVSFLDCIPSPEEEICSVVLKFKVAPIRKGNVKNVLAELFGRRNLECSDEPDGMAVYLALNGILDIYIKSDGTDIIVDGTIETSFAGAGVYKEAYYLILDIAEALGGRAIFGEAENVTYTKDRDFDKLSQLHYEIMRQQLIFAVADDREGMQSFLGWGADGYEPPYIQGTVVTFAGRLELSRIIEEIEKYGFSYVADKYFLIRNTPEKSADEYAKTGISMMWTNTSFDRSDRCPEDAERNSVTLNNFDLAIKTDKYVSIPKKEYIELCRLDGREPLDISECRDYISHFPIGYLRGEVNYGFGSYLRRFRLSGHLIPREIRSGEIITFDSFDETDTHIFCNIEYSEGDAEADDGFFEGFDSEIQICDIGGTAFCRYTTGKCNEGFYGAAEIIIKDERYSFLLSTADGEAAGKFADIISECRCIEDVDDFPIPEDSEKPRAFGGTFFRQKSKLAVNEAIDKGMASVQKLFFGNLEIADTAELHNGRDSSTASKIGGIAYLEDNEEIPLFDGKRMKFLAQVNFAHTALPEQFPTKGVLQLFVADLEEYPVEFISNEQMYFKLIYREKIPEISYDTEAVLMDFKVEPMPLPPVDYRFNKALAASADNIAPDLLGNVIKDYYKGKSKKGSRVGGYPDFYNGDPRCEEIYSNYSELLLQLDLDSGILNLFISKENLTKKDFSDVLLVYTQK